MRILLDADLSRRRIGAPLERRGHDVVALQADAARRSLSDELVLEWAATEERILVTRNARHFQPLARAWIEQHRMHAGLILVWTMQSNEFRDIVSAVNRVLAEHPDAESWHDLVLSI
jgi:predicted nuclease of predicted toxin-antitoxin system